MNRVMSFGQQTGLGSRRFTDLPHLNPAHRVRSGHPTGKASVAPLAAMARIRSRFQELLCGERCDGWVGRAGLLAGAMDMVDRDRGPCCN
jgi:hypothetical protein